MRLQYCCGAASVGLNDVLAAEPFAAKRIGRIRVGYNAPVQKWIRRAQMHMGQSTTRERTSSMAACLFSRKAFGPDARAAVGACTGKSSAWVPRLLRSSALLLGVFHVVSGFRLRDIAVEVA